MQAKVKKLSEGRYVLVKEPGGQQVTVPMKGAQIRALIVEVLYGPRVDLLLAQADEEYEQQVDFEEVVVEGSSETDPPSLPAGEDDTEFQLVDEEDDQPDTVTEEPGDEIVD